MLISLIEAGKRLGVSKDTLRQHVREGRFTLYRSPRDRREKLVDSDELDAYLEPKVLQDRSDKFTWQEGDLAITKRGKVNDG